MNRGLLAHRQALPITGYRYFIIHPKGDAFACYPAKRYDEGYLGNIYDGTLRLGGGPMSCPYKVCPCTVPQNQGNRFSMKRAAASAWRTAEQATTRARPCEPQQISPAS